MFELVNGFRRWIGPGPSLRWDDATFFFTDCHSGHVQIFFTRALTVNSPGTANQPVNARFIRFAGLRSLCGFVFVVFPQLLYHMGQRSLTDS